MMPDPDLNSETKTANLAYIDNHSLNSNLMKENIELKKKLHMFETNYTLLMDKFNALMNSNILSINNTDSNDSNIQ